MEGACSAFSLLKELLDAVAAPSEFPRHRRLPELPTSGRSASAFECPRYALSYLLPALWGLHEEAHQRT
jgi:hypothetical protein